jgi:hypothetical protein
MMEKLTALCGSRCADITCVTAAGTAAPGAAQAPDAAHPIKIRTPRPAGFNILARELLNPTPCPSIPSRMSGMNAKMRRNLPGPFAARNLGVGSWRLACGHLKPVDVILRGAPSEAEEALSAFEAADLDIEWHAETVVLTMTSAGRQRSINARSALIHEPLAQLYDALPLAAVDEKMRRFWRRVFRLIRIPGGRYLLGVLARRSGTGRAVPENRL